MSIRNKMLSLLFANIMLVITIFTIFTYFSSKRFIETNVGSAKKALLIQTAENVDFIRKDIADLSTFLSIDTDVQKLLQDDNPGIAMLLDDNEISESKILNERSFLVNTAFKFILNIITSKSYISCISIYGENNFPAYAVSSDTSTANRDYWTVKSTAQYRKAVAKRGAPHWFYLDEGASSFFTYNPFPKLAMIRALKDLDGKQDSVLGILIMTVNEETIEDIYGENIDSEDESILIFNDEDILISGVGSFLSSSERLLQEILERNADNRSSSFFTGLDSKRIFINYYSTEDGWHYVHATDTGLYLQDTKYIRWLTLLTIILCMTFSIPLAFTFSNFLTRPIESLLRSMEHFQKGNFDEKVHISFNDEIGRLGEGYNAMVQNIRRLIEEVYVLEIREKEAELDALQAQINPHFLYNMLDTLSWKALRRGEEEISMMIRSLSRVFRLSLNQGKNLTLVGSEKELIENYLTLQKIRFKDRLHYRIEVDPDIHELIIPKLLIQPIVENAVVHSVEDTSDEVSIRVAGEIVDENMVFTVEDNGKGMSAEEIQKISKSGTHENENSVSTKKGGYAIRNIRLRLNIYYGESYSFRFSSTPGAGTTVRLSIPTTFPKERISDQTTHS